MKIQRKYCLAAIVAFCLSLLCGVLSFASLPGEYVQLLPEDSQSVLDQVTVEYVNCELREDGTIVPLTEDPQVYLLGLERSFTTLCLETERLSSGTQCQLFYGQSTEALNEADSITYKSSKGATEKFLTLESGSYAVLRLDIDGSYILKDVLVSDQIPEQLELNRLERLMQGDLTDVNLAQWAVSFVILLAQAVLIAWRWGAITRWVIRCRTTCRANPRGLCLALARLAGAVALSAGLYALLGAVGWLSYSWVTGTYFVLGGFALGWVAALYPQAGEHPERVFFGAALSVGLILTLILPQATIVSLDDETHYTSALTVSYCGTAYYTQADIDLRYQNVDWELTLESAQRIREEQQRSYEAGAVSVVEQDFSLTKLAYLPSAAGIWLMRAVGAPFAAMFAAGRIGSLLSYLFLIALAMRRLGGDGLLAGLFALLPTPFYIASNYSYDGWCIGLMALGVAIFLDEYRHPERPLRAATAVGMLVCITLSCVVKPVYAPVYLLLLFLPKEKFRKGGLQRKHYILLGCAAVALLALSFILPVLASGGGNITDTRGGSEVSSVGQVKYILYHPLTFAGMMLRFLFGEYLRPTNLLALGLRHLGYLPVSFAGIHWLLLLFTAVFFLCRSKEEQRLHQPRLGLKLLAVFVFLSGVSLAALSMYVAYTAVGATWIQGCQARYQLPLLLAMVLVIRPNCIPFQVNRRWWNTGVLGAETALLLLGFWPIAASYL